MWTSVYIHFLSFYTVVCNPPCENGACVANDTCSCSAGYEGVRCNETGMYSGRTCDPVRKCFVK